jgi:hypothetical protein
MTDQAKALSDNVVDFAEHRRRALQQRIREAVESYRESRREIEWQKFRERYQICPHCGRPT